MIFRLFFGIHLLFFSVNTSLAAQAAEVQFFTPQQLEVSITNPDSLPTFDFILLDVRDNSEVAGGIIASQFCKPYHLSWNFDDLQNNYSLIPTDMRVIIYCRSGNRSLQAANFLVGKGFEMVASIDGGINSYTGQLMDSTEFKSWDKLPEPSYVGVSPIIISKSVKHHEMRMMTGLQQQLFTLQGRRIQSQSLECSSSSIFVLERVIDKTTGRTTGIHQAVHIR